MAEKTSLVIVESPSKAKTIGKYLGDGYRVKACMGHLRDLPKSTMGVDIEHDFEPQYGPLKGKEHIIEDLRSAAEASDKVYLATDPDREGEAISWHLTALLDLDEAHTNRVTFNEITRRVVTEAIQHPRPIDINLVDAQQARRVLDRVVGYQLSPLLWKKVRRGLSAGRVQSVATKLVVDRENEIRAFVPQEYWTIDVMLRRENGQGNFSARYFGETKKRELHSEEEADEILRDVTGKPFQIKTIKVSTKKKSAPPPFITSTLQQEASRKLNMTPKRTMAIAQQLYEGVEIEGVGAVGLITYMRTDSLRLSDEAMAAAKDYIETRYGTNFHYGEFRQFKAKSGAQDAHEAIRPSNVELDPARVERDLTRDQFRLYKLIWSRFLASQMANALYDTMTIDSECEGHLFRANYQALKFSGFTAVYEEGRDDEQEEKLAPLPNLQEGEALSLTDSKKEQHFTQPPARYTEATLVRAMEEKGVGRPSTYAAIISIIQDREYVVKQDKKLSPTPLGEVVNGLMAERFADIVDVEFTANMEKKLDDVEAGKTWWKDVLKDFYVGFHADMENAEKALEGIHLKVPDEVTEEICELCGKNMVIKFGRFGKFLACPGYPECKNTKPIVERMPGRCPKCSAGMLKRKSQRGYAYYACERGAECGFMSWDVPTEQDCPVCGQTMFKKSGRGRMTPFCINPDCENFLPEDKRGYRKKTVAAETDAAETEQTSEETKSEKKTTSKKTASKTTKTTKTTKTAKSSKTAKAETKKPAAKKTTKKGKTE